MMITIMGSMTVLILYEANEATFTVQRGKMSRLDDRDVRKGKVLFE